MNTGSPKQRTTKASILMMAAFLITSGAPEMALADSGHVSTTPAANATPARTISPQQVAEIEAYEQAADQTAGQGRLPPQTHSAQQVQRPSYSLAPWVIVMRDAITTLASALWIAAMGFAIGFVLWGVSRLIAAWRK
ncbi:MULTISPECIES: hypothetical protein [Acidithiobacillus]|uniref:hypothetical protein n=1 Tax=Acidithiobacillus ferrivorans TaxID=160808 RepID=UPI001C0765A1|nr:hypothetical protein [Acidithiobacillus ferrivorans]MBU2852314.1 hypothetical protein [Acidithiobacillus ferrivorans]